MNWTKKKEWQRMKRWLKNSFIEKLWTIKHRWLNLTNSILGRWLSKRKSWIRLIWETSKLNNIHKSMHWFQEWITFLVLLDLSRLIEVLLKQWFMLMKLNKRHNVRKDRFSLVLSKLLDFMKINSFNIPFQLTSHTENQFHANHNKASHCQTQWEEAYLNL